MNDINAFERLVADVADDLMGPSRSFEAAAIVQSAKPMGPRGRSTELVQRTMGDRLAPTGAGFSTLSVVKFVAAAAIVALFGGFLLMGILTTPREGQVLPAAETESPSPVTNEERLSGMVTEEIEPGVFLVVNDGVRDLAGANNLDIVAGHDGGIWLLRPQRFVRLGDEEWHAWPHTKPEITVFEVAPDGTIWAQVDDGARAHLYSVAKGSDDWKRTTGDAPDHVWVTSDGTAWARWGLTIGYLSADGWQTVGEGFASNSGVFLGHFVVSDRGEVWAIDRSTGLRSRDLQHLVDDEWRTYDGLEDLPERVGGADRAAVGHDGTLWGTTRRGGKSSGGKVFRFDGTEWMTFEGPGWMPTAPEGDLWTSTSWGELRVAADGSLWVSARLGEQWWTADELRGYDRPVCDRGIDGVVRFDGVTWSRFLQGRCVESMDIAADGSVWLLTSESGAWSGARAGSPPIQTQTYVITPEAMTINVQ